MKKNKHSYVVEANFGGFDGNSRIISVSLDLETALTNKKNFETQMSIQKRVPAPFRITNNSDSKNLGEEDFEEYSNWFDQKSTADGFDECVLKIFNTGFLYNQDEPDIEDDEILQNQTHQEGYPKFLVRPDDFTVFVKLENGKYMIKETVDSEMSYIGHGHHYEALKSHRFFPCTEDEFPALKIKQDFHYGYTSWASRNDGHGGCKGGTVNEYKEYLKRVEKFNRLKDEE